jgi:hypothetical protein
MMPLWYAPSSAIASGCTDSDRLPARQTIQMAQRWTIARPWPHLKGTLRPAQSSPVRGFLLPIISWVGFVHHLTFVRICTDFRLARRSKWRNDGPERAYRPPPHGRALPRAEFPCAGLFASDHFLGRLRPPAQLPALYGYGPNSRSPSDPKGAKLTKIDDWRRWEDVRGRLVRLSLLAIEGAPAAVRQRP